MEAILTTLIPRLSAYCSEDSYRGNLAKPFTALLDGAPHTVATDGRIMLIVEGDHGFASESAAENIGADVRPVLAWPRTSTPVPLGMAAIRDFIGIPVEVPEAPPCETCKDTGVVECDECDGDGMQECECDCGDLHEKRCERCKGEGDRPCPSCEPAIPDTDFVKIGARMFMRSLLFRAFRYLPDGVAMWHEGEDSRATLVTGDGWRLLVMPVRADAKPDTPHFVLPVTANG